MPDGYRQRYRRLSVIVAANCHWSSKADPHTCTFAWEGVVGGTLNNAYAIERTAQQIWLVYNGLSCCTSKYRVVTSSPLSWCGVCNVMCVCKSMHGDGSIPMFVRKSHTVAICFRLFASSCYCLYTRLCLTWCGLCEHTHTRTSQTSHTHTSSYVCVCAQEDSIAVTVKVV